ncbi:dedicator of cytokinesis protein 3-like isoform X2 [Crassostrea angulata]|uniref:dedicator of cytokinesis protein 3-like isoform X2 n=1 Tax=Magallana angulata TaxID=2784310 RepID=UPI0022B0A072|nr:dedicator of cytokinesis protein 3-like isoform X2 [Crassostrea angulata]
MDNGEWRPADDNYGVAICTYKPRVEKGLSLNVGETVHILEEYGGENGWYYGESMSRKTGWGIFPKSFIHIKDCITEGKGQYQTVIPKEDHMVRELTFGLREWFQTWKTKYLCQGWSQMLDDVAVVMADLTVLRGRLLKDTLSAEQATSLREEIATLVDWGNGQLGMDFIPRKNGQELNPDECSVIELHRVHSQGVEKLRSTKSTKRTRLPTESCRTEEGNIFNLLVCYRSNQCNIADDSIVYLSIYSAKDDKFISEQYEIRLNKNGFPVDVERSDILNSLFTDLSPEDVNKNLFLVVRIYRYGRMLHDHKEHKKPLTSPYRRPWGVGVLSVREIQEQMDIVDDLYECNLKVVSCTDDSIFSEFHESLIKRYSISSSASSSQLKASASNPERASLGLHLAVKIITGDLKKCQTEHPMLFTKGLAVIQKMDFSDVINPGEVRNDVYLELREGDFDRDGKKAQKNVEVKVTVLDKEGRHIPKCINYGYAEELQDTFRSSVLYHNNGPKWGEIVRISIPMEKFPGSSVLFEISHCSTKASKAEKKLCGFAFMRLTDDEDIVIKDAFHNLCIYKCEDPSKIKYEKYKTMPFLVDDWGMPRQSVFISKSLPYVRSPKETMQVSTKLTSTKFTQTSELLGILKWKDCMSDLDKNLDKLMKLQGGEIMKFLSDILDALFEMLQAGNQTPYYTKVFHALTFILNLLLDSRFENFVPVLDSYLKETFTSPLVHTHLMSLFSSGIERAVNGESFPVAMSLKVLAPLVRFIVRSRELETLNPMCVNPKSDQEFSILIAKLFDSFGLLLSSKDQKLKISQMALLSNLQKSFETFVVVMTKRELAEYVKAVISKLPSPREISEDVARNKMEFIREIVNSELFIDDESRSVLLPLCVSQVRNCLLQKTFLQLVTNTLGDLLDKLFKLKQEKDMADDIEMFVKMMFQVMVDTTLSLSEKVVSHPSYISSSLSSQHESNDFDCEEEEVQKKGSKRQVDRDRRRTLTGINFFNKGRPPSMSMQPSVPNLKTVDSTPVKILDIGELYKKRVPAFSMEDLGLSGEMISCMAELLRLMEHRHYNVILKPTQSSLKDFLGKVLLTFRELIKEDLFPSGWTVMRMVINNALFTAIEYLSTALSEHFLQKDQFNQQLWSHYFNLSVAFITQPSLQLEMYSEAKKQKIVERYQDMRILMGQQIQTLWENLGANRRHFIPSLIGPFLKVTLVPEEELRKATIPIFFDMMESEMKTCGNFQMVENEMIEKLDEFITSENLGDTDYMALFSTILLEKVEKEPELKDNGRQFVLSVTNLLERLLDYRQVCGGEDHRSSHMKCTFNILNFYKDNTNKEEMYIRYIKKLYDLHLGAQNYVEAGLTLKLYAQLLQWKDGVRKEELDYLAQPEWERKERVYLQILDCFDKGKVWEYGIPLCKELADVYEKKYEYRKLSNILERQARFFSNILDGVKVQEEGQDRPVFYPRQEPTYFRVAYYGQLFPPFVRNKVFIYRGNECLKLQDIINQLKQEYPMATILQFNNVIDDQKKMGEAQYIQIGSVKPRPEDKPEFVYNSGVAPEIKNFYTVNDVSTFQFDRSFHRGEKDPNNEFKTLCTERLVMHTNYTFPGILQWYEVIRTEQLTLSPVCTANEAVKSACKELQKEIDKTKKDSSIDAIKSLSMKLQGMISASVQGGIPKYQEAFFSPDYERLHPEERDRIRELKELLNEQVKLLDHGLHLMKTMDRMHGTGLSDMLRSLGEILRDIKESLGMQSSSVRRSSSHLSVSSVREVNRRSDSGVESMLVEQRPGTPGGGSIQSSGSNRSSGFSAADAVSEELVDLSEPDQGPQEPPKGAYSNNSKKKRPFSMILSTEKKPRVPPKSVWYDSGTVSSSLLEKSISDPDISRQPSHKYPDSFSRDSPFRHPGLSAEPIPEKPEPPPKQRQPKETQELVKSEISATSNRVPPLPPRKPSLGKQTNGLHRPSMYEPVESSQSSDTPPPIPQRASVLRSTVPKPAPRSSVIRHEENSRL